MTWNVVRYRRVTLRHAIERDIRASRRGSTEGAGAVSKCKKRPRVQLTLATAVNNVIAAHTHGLDGPVPQSLRNRKSLLLKAAAALGVSETDFVDRILGPALESSIAALRTHFSAPQLRKLATDLASALKWWDRATIELHPAAMAVPRAAESPRERVRLDRKFSAFLRAAIVKSGLSQREVCERSGIPLPTLQGWLTKGVRPSRAWIGMLQPLADVLDLPLAELLRHARRRLMRDLPPQRKSSYSSYLHKCRSERVNLQDDEVSPALREEWHELVRHQTGDSRRLKRSKHTGWRRKDWSNRRAQPKWYEAHRGQYMPAANAFWRRIQTYLGWLRLPEDKGGWGLDVEQCQTLAWLAHPTAVREFLEWGRRRAGDEVNMGQRNFRQTVHSMCTKDTGWLRQQPAFMARLPECFRADSWDSLCDDTLEVCQEHASNHRKIGRTRDPFVPIRPLLELDDPCEPVFQAIDTLMDEANMLQEGSLAQAVADRDAAMLAFLMIVPVRITTFMHLTFGTHGKGLWFEFGKFNLVVPKTWLKNGEVTDALEIRGLESDLLEPIVRYLNRGRRRLVGDVNTDLLFVASRDPRYMWHTASQRLVDVTYRFMSEWIPYGLPMHTFRHLVASRYLKLHPGEYQGVASLLHDRLETVLDTYAPKDPTHAFARNARRHRD